ncbi:ATP synthase subunit, ATPase_gene1 superfamily [Psychroflexus torquis ATCC 700755]|uniref:ATP synthase subunit, ATPase_gene1 superfamily n=1 Tax=Psychroflexus torquis (strain ATCC 700755 / CIP 106069 / ACAM 623) TaxID=313595 RepID=K4II76_PSYTT|nr:AtpZ/AtpI family protein [Psychroflexus torquis]AFU68791.1 ATP synthase subunit, ATPase_gene1 superfamily [Psychroflexus torquis ATCC 700755]
MPKKKNQPKPWLYFTGLGLQMAIIIIGSVFLGIWLDETFMKSLKLFTIIISLLGIFISMAHVIASLKHFKD